MTQGRWEVFSTTTVSLKHTLEPAQTVLSSSAITGEDKNDFTRLAYQTFDVLQSVSLSDVLDTSGQGEGAVTGVHEVAQPDARGSHGVPDDLSLWGSSKFRSEKSGFHPFNFEDPSCAIIDLALDERLIADDSLTVIMEANLATAQLSEFLIDKLRA